MSFWFLWYEFSSWADFHQAFLGMQPINQILVFIALVAVSVASILLAYYIIKESVILTWKILKNTFVLFQATGKSMYNDAVIIPSQPRRIRSPRMYSTVQQGGMAQTVVQQPAMVNTQMVQEKSVQTKILHHNQQTSQTMFCPICGQPFSSDMMELFKNNKKVFCEFCGKQLENRE
ncbi:MAG: hypothetical protein ACTSVU_09325 [Promethearchaeota archaeon]